VDTTAAARRWAETWERSWPAADVDAIDALYAADAVFYSQPFRDAQGPREYVSWAFEDQAAAECRFGPPIVQGERAAVDWWGVITSVDGTVESLAGTSLLRFDGEGRVTQQRDVWASVNGRHELPSWATSE
jgi:hypothetical protein